MAKRKAKRKGTTRRRKIGALNMNPNGPVVKFGSAALGFFLGDKINGAIEKAIGDKMDGKIIGAAEAGIGLLLMMKKGKKPLPLALAAGVLAGAGAKKLLGEFGVINGFSDVPVIAGYKTVPVISGYNVPGSINGFTVPRAANVMGAVYDGTGSGSGVNNSDR